MRIRSLRSLVAWCLIMAATGIASAATTRYVALSGDGSDGSTWAKAYTNIQDAVNASSSDDTILIKQGIYSNVTPVTVDGKSLTIQGGFDGTTPEPGPYTTDPLATVIDCRGSNRVMVIVNCTTGLVERLTIRNGSSTVGAGLYLTNTVLTVRDCMVRDNSAPSSMASYGGGVYMLRGNVNLVRCKLRSNRVQGTSNGGALYQNAGTLTMDSCWIEGNKIYNGFSDGAGVYVANSTSTRLFNCLIVNNAARNYGGVHVSAGTVQIENCTVAGNSPHGVSRSGGTMTVTNSIVYDNGDDVNGAISVSNSCVGEAMGGAGNVYADPKFVTGYYLGAGSPCTNAGGAAAADLGLDTRYAEQGATDSGPADLGYHYESAYSAGDRYVSPLGTDDGSHGTGPGAGAYRSVTYALSKAADNTRIHIEAGIYSNNVETFPLAVGKDGIELLGTNAALTVLHGNNAGFRVVTVSNVVGCMVSNVTIRNGYPASGTPGGGIYMGLAGVKTIDCAFYNNTVRDNGGFGGGLYVEGGSLGMLRCKLRNNKCTSSGYGGALYRLNGNTTLSSCELTANQNDPLLGNARSGAAVYAGSSGFTRLVNCLVDHNNSYNGGVIGNGSGTLRIENCTVVRNTPAGIEQSGGTVVVTNSIVYDNSDDLRGAIGLSYSRIGDTNGGASVSYGDPGFALEFYLADGSPCIDAAADTASSLGLDALYAQAAVTDSGPADYGYHRQAAAAAWGDVYVSPLGTDDGSHGSGPGSSAYRSLTYALGRTPAYTRVHVEAGTYSNTVETFPLTVAVDGIELLGTNANLTVITAGGTTKRALQFVEALVCVLSNVTVRGGGTADNGAGVNTLRSDVQVVDCVIRDTAGNGYNYAGGALYVNGGRTEVLRCKLRNNSAAGTSYGGAIYHAAGNMRVLHSELTGNRLLSNPRDGMAVYGASSGYLRLFNCLLANNTGGQAGAGAIHDVGVGSVSVESCTLGDNGPVGVKAAQGVIVFTNSVAWNNVNDLDGPIALSYSCIGDTNGGTGVIQGDPKFALGYYLADDSPCTNAGGDTAASLGLTGLYAQATMTDVDVVDLGYHYPSGVAVSDGYVSPLGTDDISHGTGPGSDAYRSITYALSRAGANSRIYIEAGLYGTNVETFPLVIPQSGILLLATNSELTVVNATGANQRVLSAASLTGIVISNLTLCGGNVGTAHGAGAYLVSSGVSFYDCVIRDNTANGSWVYGGGVMMSGGNVEMVRCKIRGNRALSSGYGGGVAQSAGGQLKMTQCVVSECRSTGGSGGVGGGLLAEYPGSMTLRNCLIVSNSANQMRGGGIYLLLSSGVVLENVTVADNTGDGIYALGGYAVLTNSIAWGNSAYDATGTVRSAYSSIGTGSFTNLGGTVQDDPVFADRTHYHLGSRRGFYVGGYFDGGTWRTGGRTSTLLDTGAPGSDFSQEPAPNYGLELGAYGNTPVASVGYRIPGGSVFLVR